MKKKSLVSVIIPVFNCERYLGEAIDSVLAQTLSDLEILIVDDGSTDNTASVARSYNGKVQFLSQAKGGIGAARNRGIKQSNGKFLAFLDADDIWTEEKLQTQIETFEKKASLDMVFGLVKQFISPDLDENQKTRIHCPNGFMLGYSPSTMLIRHESFKKVGLFETNWKVGEFIGWYLKATDMGLNHVMLQKLFLKRRLHKYNQGRRERQAVTDYARILKASLDRRRKALKKHES